MNNTPQRILLALMAITFGVLMTSCAGLEIARERAGAAIADVGDGYCDRPMGHRLILRAEANRALDGRAAILIVCAEDASYEDIYSSHIAPILDRSLEAALIPALLGSAGEGGLKVPGGRFIYQPDEPPDIE